MFFGLYQLQVSDIFWLLIERADDLLHLGVVGMGMRMRVLLSLCCEQRIRLGLVLFGRFFHDEHIILKQTCSLRSADKAYCS